MFKDIYEAIEHGNNIHNLNDELVYRLQMDSYWSKVNLNITNDLYEDLCHRVYSLNSLRGIRALRNAVLSDNRFGMLLFSIRNSEKFNNIKKLESEYFEANESKTIFSEYKLYYGFSKDFKSIMFLDGFTENNEPLFSFEIKSVFENTFDYYWDGGSMDAKAIKIFEKTINKHFSKSYSSYRLSMKEYLELSDKVNCRTICLKHFKPTMEQ